MSLPLKILITGAAGHGFVGRNLREALIRTERYEVFAPPRTELDLLDIDALKGYVHGACVDIIVHAAVHVPMFHGADKEYYNDMKMFWNVHAVSKDVEKIIYFGSGAEYDKRFDIRGVREEQIGESIPVSEYGLAKYTINHVARSSDNIYNLRLFGIFGKYELWRIKFISNLCCKAVFDLPLTVRQDCLFDFLYVDDLPDIVSWFLENRPRYHDYNVCCGKGYSLIELAETVRKISGKNLDIRLLDETRNLDYTASNDRLKAQISGLKITPMCDAIKDLYKYYEENRNLIDFDELKASR